MADQSVYSGYLKTPSELVTTEDAIRSGFIRIASEKNRRSTQYIEEAKVLKHEISKISYPSELMDMRRIRRALIMATGLPESSVEFFSEADMDEAINNFIKNFLEPKGQNFADEVIYRYLLLRGNPLEGSMKGMIEKMAHRDFVMTLTSVLASRGISFKWSDGSSGPWASDDVDAAMSDSTKALSWTIDGRTRVLAFDLKIPMVDKAVDLSLFDCNPADFRRGAIADQPAKILMLGQLRGNVDPATASDSWKASNTILERIRIAFRSRGHTVNTAYLGSAIDDAVAEEIWKQLETGALANATNMTSEGALIEFCSWMLDL